MPRAAIDDLLAAWGHRPVVALTGAGISTDSGIPDYRGEGTRARLRKPIQHAEFIGDPSVRQRYWARSFIGWKTIATAEPNAGHRALAALEDAGLLCGIITQNVDRLHTDAGSKRVVELHGALADVICLECGARCTRTEVQERLATSNDGWLETVTAAGLGTARPDGDRELAAGLLREFVVAECLACAGALKPDVVFFGGAVEKSVLENAWSLYREAELLVVVGSSLAVYSGYRFVRQAERDGVEVAIINRGESRGDNAATFRIIDGAGETLSALADALAV